MPSEKTPLTKSLTADVDALAVGVDGSGSVGAVPFAGTVASVAYTPSAAITGANTNSRTLTLVNKGQAGSGSTTIATLALTSGVNAAAFDETALTLSGTAANLEVAEGDVLAFVSTHVGTGIADPGGEVTVRVSRS